MMIDGFCDPAFSRITDAFAANFAERGEVGAAVCIFAGGRKVVDLWGGHRDAGRTLPWQEDTLVCMMSVGKGMAAIGVHRLIEQGRVSLDQPLAHYWPEFGQAGKGDVLVHHVLGSTSGVLYADSAPPGSVLDWAVMTDAVARQPAEWAPGTRGAYQSMTMGFLLGELIRRVDGRTVDRYFAEEIAGPLGADYGWSLDAGQIARTADIIGNAAHHTVQAFADPSTKLGRAWRARPTGTTFYNTPEFRGGVLPSSNGHGTARGVATIYAALLEDGLLVSHATRERMRTLSWDMECGMTGRPYRYAYGFFLDKPPLVPLGPNPGAFGHPGAGGALGFVDPEAGIAFAYAPNAMCEGAGSGDRCTALVDALFQ